MKASRDPERLRQSIYLLVSLILIMFAVAVVVPPLFLKYIIGYDYEIALPNGYLLSRVEGWSFVVNNPSSERVVDLTVQSYAVKGDMVTGFVTHKGKGNHPHKSSPEGYFTLNTATGVLHEGLTEDMWRAALPTHGFSTPPVLKEPRREDAIDDEK